MTKFKQQIGMMLEANNGSLSLRSLQDCYKAHTKCALVCHEYGCNSVMDLLVQCKDVCTVEDTDRGYGYVVWTMKGKMRVE